MQITAKTRCYHKLEGDGQVVYGFSADYLSDEGRVINAEWAKFTPALTLSITVKPEIEFKVGGSYTLTFDDGE